MSEAMDAEFDTVAEWTAEAARALGEEFFLPAACRGSGSPAALDWLIDALELSKGDVLLDCGAGVGGPARYAVQERGVHVLLAEPEAGDAVRRRSSSPCRSCRPRARLCRSPITRSMPHGRWVSCAQWMINSVFSPNCVGWCARPGGSASSST